MGFDYRKLLIAYMTQVIGKEGVTFLDLSPPFKTAMDDLDDDERDELRRIECKARKLI
jgi:hypothetical protein